MNLFKKNASLTLLALLTGACATGGDQNTANYPTPPAEVLTKTNVYRNGTFTARGWYGNLPSSITVTVTLTDDLITGVKVQPHATDPTSLDLQKRFAAAVPGVIIGKPIAEVKVGKLAGSSGTPVGFNNAIEKIKREAAQK